MSQSSFLESVVTWDLEECQEKLQETLPKLITYFTGAESNEEIIGIFKIICHSFLPCIPAAKLDDCVFSRTMEKVCEVFSDVVEDIKCQIQSLPSKAHSSLQDNILTHLQILLEVLDCCEVCVKVILDAQAMFRWVYIQSLPIAVLTLLRNTYNHCKALHQLETNKQQQQLPRIKSETRKFISSEIRQMVKPALYLYYVRSVCCLSMEGVVFPLCLAHESGEIYGDLLMTVSELLSQLFKKAHSLQSSFLNLFEKVVLDDKSDDLEIEVVCKVCEELYGLCHIVSSLDVKLVIHLWKAISRYTIQKKLYLKNHLDVDAMMESLCDSIYNGYEYLLQLVTVDHQDAPSPADEKNFQKSVKILGFQIKVVVMVTKEYVDYYSTCLKKILSLISHLYRLVPPSLQAQPIQEQYLLEVQGQLIGPIEPLIGSLAASSQFVIAVTSKETALSAAAVDTSFQLLLISLHVADILPKQTEEVKNKWLWPQTYEGEDERWSLVELVFHCFCNCKLEVNEGVMLPAPMTGGKQLKNVPLYEYVCIHLCGLIGCYPKRYFKHLEKSLLDQVMSCEPYVSLLAMDVWCFVARYGTADLCYSHVSSLMTLCRHLHPGSSAHSNIVHLIGRLLKFIVSEHLDTVLKCFPVESNLSIWAQLPLDQVKPDCVAAILESLTKKCLSGIEEFLQAQEITDCHLYNFRASLYCLTGMLSCQHRSQHVTPSMWNAIADKTKLMWSELSSQDWMAHPLTQLCVADMLLISSCVLTFLDLDIYVKMLTLMASAALKDTCSTYLKLAMVEFLRKFASVKMSKDIQGRAVLDNVCSTFSRLMQDSHAVLHHCSMQCFTEFAEATDHEEIVPLCIKSVPSLQEKVIAYVNKVPYEELSQEKRIKFVKKSSSKVNIPVTISAVTEEDSELPCAKRFKHCETEEQSTQFVELLGALKSCAESIESNGEGKINANVLHKLQNLQTLINKVLLDKT